MIELHWDRVIGHDAIATMLRRMLESGDIQHAMLFTGPEGVGKFTVATIAASGILCSRGAAGEACGVCPSCQALKRGSHPDLYILSPEGSNIKIDQVRAMQREMAMSPCLSERRVCIIETAELMTEQAANSLLKILEEPPAYLVFILTVAQRYRLLDTIVSRCRLFSFQPVSAWLIADTLKERGAEATLALTAARLSGGRIGAAHSYAQPGGLANRDAALDFLIQLTEERKLGLLEVAAKLYEQEDKSGTQLTRHLCSLIRDLLVLRQNAEPQQLVFNIDRLDRLAAMAAGWSEEALSRAYKAVRQAERALAANANARLASEALALELDHLYKRGEPGCRRS